MGGRLSHPLWMNASPQSSCPLCGCTSTLFQPNYESWGHYFCNGCGEFEISSLVESTVEKAVAKVRADLSSMAQELPEGRYLRIKAMHGVSLVPGNTPWVTEVATR